MTIACPNWFRWHGYGLDGDVSHRTEEWDVPKEWFAKDAVILANHGCKWGGDWKSPDRPQFQWGKGKPGPSDMAREIIRTRGVEAVWEAVGASVPP